MAYRQMEKRAPSYLEDFLAQIETLPSQLRSKLSEMRLLDEKALRLVSESEKVATEAAKRSTMKGNNVDTLKRAFHEVMAMQAQATESSSEKKRLAEEIYEVVDDVVHGLESSLKDFEKQLKKEGRWPMGENGKAMPAPVKGSLRGEGGGGGGGGGGRSRKKDSGIVLSPEDVRNLYMPTPLANVEDMPVDPNEPRYCYCNQVSFGEMVACDNKNCPYEWFHFQCVGITETPKGSWRCSDCRKSR